MSTLIRQSTDQSLNFVRPVFEKFFDLQSLDDQTLCSKAGHFGGFFKGTRLFGGHTASQSVVAAKRFKNSRQPYRLDVNFFAPGTLIHDLIYQSTSTDSDSDFLSINVYQNSILLANSTIRFYNDKSVLEQPLFHQHAQFPSNILEPNAYPKVLDLIGKLHMDDWLKKFGRSFRYQGSTDENHIFTLRPVDFLHFSGLSTEEKPVQLWARLSPALLDLQIEDPEVVLILLTDVVIGTPIFLLHDQQRIRVTSSATLTHKCIFHELDFNPRDYFFLELILHQADNTALISGRIFDQRRRLILSFVQNHYYTLHKDDLPNNRSKLIVSRNFGSFGHRFICLSRSKRMNSVGRRIPTFPTITEASTPLW
ncbi:hypothetical protein M3Y97_00198500 [Aphelenchoides bicaudatus]|nr:hypothetical protein M3Y97_00198500 [Aphelenchoides bicaudatus]